MIVNAGVSPDTVGHLVQNKVSAVEFQFAAWRKHRSVTGPAVRDDVPVKLRGRCADGLILETEWKDRLVSCSDFLFPCTYLITGTLLGAPNLLRVVPFDRLQSTHEVPLARPMLAGFGNLLIGGPTGNGLQTCVNVLSLSALDLRPTSPSVGKLIAYDDQIHHALCQVTNSRYDPEYPVFFATLEIPGQELNVRLIDRC